MVGRSPLAPVRCDDPGLEPFHLQLDLPADADGAPAWCQLAGRRPVVADGTAELAIGTSVLRLEPIVVGDVMPESSSPRAVVSGARVVRRARQRPDQYQVGTSGLGADRGRIEDPEDDPDDDPDDDPNGDPDGDPDGGSHAGVLPALVTLAVGVTVAVALHQPMFALMGAVGAAVAVSTWTVAALRRRRRHRRRARRLDARAAQRAGELDRRRQDLAHRRRAAQPGLVGAMDALDHVPSALWQRRTAHGDAFTAVLGTGAIRVARGQATPQLVLDRVPVTVDLGAGARVALTGVHALATTRSLLGQLAVTTGPADWSLLVVSSFPARWRWATGLPHVQLAGTGEVAHDAVALAELISAAGPTAAFDCHLLVVTDDLDEVAVRTSGIRRLLHARPDAALLTCVDAGGAGGARGVVPALCSTVAHTTADGGLRVELDGLPDADLVVDSMGGGSGGRCRLAGLGEEAASALAAALAPWSDPEASPDHARALPGDVPLESLLVRASGADRTGIAARWRTLGPDARPCAPLGVAVDGVVDVDLVRDGPHALVAGTTGSGKSELLRTLVVSLAACVPPDQLAFVLVDFKGGATFDDLSELPHVVGTVTDLEPRLAERVLRSLRAEVTAREHLLRRHGCSDLATARARLGRPVMPRLVIVVDEFAALAVEHPHLLHSLVDVARRGRSLGIHLVLATQRPSGVVSDEIRTNTDLRIALRLHEAAEAVDVVGDPSPAAIRRSASGRAVVRLGPAELLSFQSARAKTVDRLVAEIAAAAEEVGAGAPARPWCDPLPVAFDSADDDALGVVDRPDEQRQEPLRWHPSDGHVLVVGSAGSGVSTALSSLAVRSLDVEAELLVIDALGDIRWDELSGLARCAGVVRLHEYERLERALARAIAAPPRGGRLVVIDGLGMLRRDVEAPARIAVHDQLEALLLGTPPGVTMLLGNDGVSGLAPAVVARCARRFVLHLHDPAEGAVFGLRAGSVPPPIAGRMVDASDGSEAQLAAWPMVGRHDRSTSRVERIAVLPDHIPAHELPGSGFDGRVWRPVLGIAHRTLEPAVLEVPLGEHVLVVGPPRSGRSEVLSRLRRCWSEARPDAAQLVISPRRLTTGAIAAAMTEAVDHVARELADGRPVLLVVDDAELVADVDGRLTAMLTGRADDLTVVAACRGEVVRSVYGHWLGELRRGRRGVVMASGSDLDGDALGVALARHPPLPPRPGLCWLVADGEAVAAQAAIGR